MRHFSVKNKIALVCLAWLVLSAASFTYIFPLLDASNTRILDLMAEKKKDLAALKVEHESEVQAEEDLQKLSQKDLHPKDFFSRDITLINELKVLEGLGAKAGVKMQFSGVSGTVKSAPKAGTITPLVVIPYGISINGEFERVVDLIEILENLSFVTNLGVPSISAAGEGTVTVNMSANFYLTQ